MAHVFPVSGCVVTVKLQPWTLQGDDDDDEEEEEEETTMMLRRRRMTT